MCSGDGRRGKGGDKGSGREVRGRRDGKTEREREGSVEDSEKEKKRETKRERREEYTSLPGFSLVLFYTTERNVVFFDIRNKISF